MLFLETSFIINLEASKLENHAKTKEIALKYKNEQK